MNDALKISNERLESQKRANEFLIGWLKKIIAAWGRHQRTKFKPDGSHFQADLEMNGLIEEMKEFLNE